MFRFWKTGDVLKRHPTGAKALEGRLVRGKEQGLWTSWFKNGVKACETHYVDGKKHGRQVNYHPNGKVFFEGDWDQGRKKGTWLS